LGNFIIGIWFVLVYSTHTCYYFLLESRPARIKKYATTTD
jgi:hypothetical protein